MASKKRDSQTENAINDVQQAIGDHNRSLKQHAGEFGQHEKARKRHYELYKLGESVDLEEVRDLLAMVNERLRHANQHLNPNVRKTVRSNLTSLRTKIQGLEKKLSNEEDREKLQKERDNSDSELI